VCTVQCVRLRYKLLRKFVSFRSVVTLGDQIITGSTNQKVSVHTVSRDRESCTVVSKLRSDIVRGNLMQMEILPLNRLLLLGTDTGNIILVC
jgi:WD repeat-containing protein 81